MEHEKLIRVAPCVNACPENLRDLVVSWSRSFKVSDGIYDAVAFVENPNF